jgi:cysteinyl-tRNA synthetase
MKLYNTLTKETEEVKPIKPGIIGMYSCGPTVYDYPHIGNWFAFIRWDVLARALRSEYDVNWVMNITDVGHLVSDDDAGEDKLEKGAKRENKTAWQVADFYGKYFLDALQKLNFSEITTIPKATDHINEQIELVKKLEAKGYTYVIEDGVYFDTNKLTDYGKLANLNKDTLLAGARVEMCPGKKNITDFALWKFSPKDQKRDMEWDSPWGKGFPGWHIECSAMSMKYLGDTLDIHCGGIDHIPVHHTNEIAQSEAATGKTFSNIWVHSNFIKVNGQKMSKSLGNLVTLEDINKGSFTNQDFRLLVLESHYRNEAQFTWEILESAKNRLARWQSVADLRHQAEVFEDAPNLSESDWLAQSKANLLEALREDLNTPKALQSIDESLDFITTNGLSSTSVGNFEDFLSAINVYLGINLFKDNINNEQSNILKDRVQARSSGNWQKSDSLRDELKELGLIVKDTPNGQVWERA